MIHTHTRARTCAPTRHMPMHAYACTHMHAQTWMNAQACAHVCCNSLVSGGACALFRVLLHHVTSQYTHSTLKQSFTMVFLHAWFRWLFSINFLQNFTLEQFFARTGEHAFMPKWPISQKEVHLYSYGGTNQEFGRNKRRLDVQTWFAMAVPSKFLIMHFTLKWCFASMDMHVFILTVTLSEWNTCMHLERTRES